MVEPDWGKPFSKLEAKVTFLEERAKSMKIQKDLIDRIEKLEKADKKRSVASKQAM